MGLDILAASSTQASLAAPTPAPLAQQPDVSWPARTVQASHAAWPGGHQPNVAESWVLKENGLPDECWRTTVLQDMHLGWPGKCHDLTRTGATNAIDCHESCTKNPMCSVWQYNHMTQCWQGIGHNCGLSGWQGSDMLATGAQRLQHGDVYVLKDMRGWDIDGLADLGDTTWGSWNHTDGIINCRSWCYSNLRCQVWTYAEGHCFAEDPSPARKPLSYPLVVNVNARQTSDLAKLVLAGEFIEHVCPPRPPSVNVTVSDIVTDGHSISLQDVFVNTIIVAGLLFAFARIWFRMRGEEYKLKIKWLEKVAEEELAESTPLSGALKEFEHHRLVPVSVETMFTPGLLDVLLHRNFATSYERHEVRKVAPEAPASYANYLAWRRMTIASLCIVGIISYVMQVRVLYSTYRHHIYFSSLGSDNNLARYQTWVATNPPNPSFLQYSEEKMLMILGHILGETLRGAFLTDLVVCAVELAPLICLFTAMLRWTSFAASRRYVLFAWMTSFAAAYGMSLFPVRFVLSFTQPEAEADQYAQEIVVALNLDKAQTLLLGSCDQITEDRFTSQLSDFGASLKRVCDNLSMFPLELALPCFDSSSLCNVNLADALEGCSEAVQQFQYGHVDKASNILVEQCKKIRDAFISPTVVSSNGTVTTSKKAVDILVDMIRIPFRLVVPSVELTSLTISALHTILMVIPSVLSIAPGLMAAGYMTKVLAPHGALPGAFMLVVPVVLASMSWLIFSVLFQFVGQTSVLLLLFLCLCHPLVFIGIGIHYQLSHPISSGRLQQAARCSTISNAVIGVLLGVLGFQLFSGVNPESIQKIQGGMDLLAWCHVSWSRLGLALGSRTVYAFALTYFGACDWIIAGEAVQQRYWTRFLLGHAGRVSEDKISEDTDDAPTGGRARLVTRMPDEDTVVEDSINDDEALNEAVWELLWHRFAKRHHGVLPRRPRGATAFGMGGRGVVEIPEMVPVGPRVRGNTRVNFATVIEEGSSEESFGMHESPSGSSSTE